jgi:5-methylcytosine-specific restriction endonuclease McrA
MRPSYYRVVSPIVLEREKEGKCPNCGKPKTEWGRRTDWTCCSVDCTENYYKEFDITYTWESHRYEVFKRDNGVCAKCKLAFVKKSLISDDLVPNESSLIADHIIPIELGGSMWDKSNIQTLCIDCNKVKTKIDMGNIAKHRRRFKKHLHDLRHKPIMIPPFVHQETL